MPAAKKQFYKTNQMFAIKLSSTNSRAITPGTHTNMNSPCEPDVENDTQNALETWYKDTHQCSQFPNLTLQTVKKSSCMKSLSTHHGSGVKEYALPTITLRFSEKRFQQMIPQLPAFFKFLVVVSLLRWLQVVDKQ